MAEFSNIFTITRCFCCLSGTEERLLQNYYIQHTTLKSILQTEQLILCYICKKLATNVEQFLNNVETAHHFIFGLKDIFKENESALKPIVNLTVTPTELIEFGTEKHSFNVECLNSSEQLTESPDVNKYIKEEQNEIILKVEETASLCDADVNSFINENIVNDDTSEFPKQEADSEVIEVEHQNYTASEETVLFTIQSKNQTQEEEVDLQKELDSLIEIIQITKYRCLNELAKDRLDAKYAGAEFKCDDCVKRFAYKACFDKHMEKHSEISGNFECDICKMRFENNDELQLHIQCHLRRYECRQCGLRKTNRGDIERHVLFKHPITAQFQCPKCKKIFKGKSGLKCHLSKSHQDGMVCEQCNKPYASKYYLRRHILQYHDLTRPVRVYSCEVCGKTLKSKMNLKLHMGTHSTKRDFYCVECDKYFKSESILNKHQKNSLFHVTAEKHPCPMCKKIFLTKKRADEHMKRAHINSPRLYCCDLCGKDFRNKGNLAAHIQDHMGIERERNFECIICNKRFYTRTQLENHRTSHTGETPHHCPECPARFGHPASLYTHRKLVHEQRKRKRRPNAQHQRRARKTRDNTAEGK